MYRTTTIDHWILTYSCWTLFIIVSWCLSYVIMCFCSQYCRWSDLTLMWTLLLHNLNCDVKHAMNMDKNCIFNAITFKYTKYTSIISCVLIAAHAQCNGCFRWIDCCCFIKYWRKSDQYNMPKNIIESHTIHSHQYCMTMNNAQHIKIYHLYYICTNFWSIGW